MPTYAKDLGNGKIEIKESDTLPDGAVTKRVESWPILQGCECHHRKIENGKVRMMNQAEKDTADKTEPIFSELKNAAISAVNLKTK